MPLSGSLKRLKQEIKYGLEKHEINERGQGRDK